jgi:catechol 2,3-dioxygenase-like lactoylglutathione lyase family enzyme
LPRPEFPFPGAWFELAGGQQLRIVRVPNPLWRGAKAMEIYENHITLRVLSFREAIAILRAHGFREDAPADDPWKMVIKLPPPTGYPQVCFFDPDQHLIELNAAVLDGAL